MYNKDRVFNCIKLGLTTDPATIRHTARKKWSTATIGAENATKIQGLIPNLKLNSHSLPIQLLTPAMK